MKKMIDYRTAAGLVILTLCAAAQAREDTPPASQKVSFDITAPSMVQALIQFTRQSGLQLAFPTKGTDDLPAPQVVGQYTPAAALDRLLKDSGLQYEFANERTVSVHAAGANLTSRPPAMSLRLAAAPRSKSSESVVKSTESDTPPSSQELPSSAVHGIPEILVRGQKSLNADIERTEDDTQPYVVFHAEDIERSQARNLEDFMRARLPMNTAQNTGSQGNASNNVNQINLRGLGANQTLILVDGRRLPGTFDGTEFGQPDINSVPLAAIERIEVLPSTASGIYGGGATGGVINIILRRDYKGLDLHAEYGSTFDGGAANRQFDASAGFSVENGRTHVMIVGSRSEANPLLTGDRDFVARARALQFANNPAAFTAGATPPAGATTNIRSNNGSNLVLDNGTALGSAFTSVPVGYAGPSSDGGATLVANAGHYNLDAPEDLSGNRASILNAPTVSSASLSVRRQFAEFVEAFTDVSWLDNKGETLFASVPTTTTLQANAPNNPFTTAINVRFPATALSVPRTSESELLRGSAGVIVRMPHNWTAGLDGSWSRSRSDLRATGPVISSAGSAALASGTLDTLRDLNSFPLDWSPYLLPSPNSIFGPIDSDLRDFNLRVSGPSVELPGGSLTLSALAERREAQAHAAFQDFMLATGTTGTRYFPERSQDVTSYYLEAQVPIVSATNSRTGVQELGLTVSGRRDEYSTSAPPPSSITLTSRDAPLPAIAYSSNDVSATKYTVGLRYVPLRSVLLRTSYGTGFLPPSISQISQNAPIFAPLALIDPKRGGISAVNGNIALIGGGSPTLTPENSTSLSVGFVLTPQFIPGFRLSVDYTEIKKTDEIVSLNPQTILNLEDFFPGRVTRAAALPGDPPGWAGPVTGVDFSALNAQSTKMHAYDVQLDYTWKSTRLGELQLYTVGTWQPKFSRQATPLSPMIDSAGYNLGPLEVRGNMGLTWSRAAWTAGWSLEYYDSYFAYSAGSSAAVVASSILNQGAAKIPSQIYQDVFIQYRFSNAGVSASSLLADTELRLGIQNVFNQIPPTVVTTSAALGYSTYGDPRLRRFSISLRKPF